MQCVEESDRIAPVIRARTAIIDSPIRGRTACGPRAALSISCSGSRLQRDYSYSKGSEKLAADRRFDNAPVERSCAYAAVIPTGPEGHRRQHRPCRRYRSSDDVRRQDLAQCAGHRPAASRHLGLIQTVKYADFHNCGLTAPYWRLPEADVRPAIPVAPRYSA